jgi:hypothetical protein
MEYCKLAYASRVLKLTSSVSKYEKFTPVLPKTRSANWIEKLVNTLVVSDTPDIPKLGVKPLRAPAEMEAVSHSFVTVTAELLATLGPLLLVLIDNPVLAARLNVGVI